MYIIIIISVVSLLYILMTPKKSKPIFGLYTMEGKSYYLKYLIFLSILYMRRICGRIRRFMFKSNEELTHDKYKKLDIAQPLSSHSKAFDAAFFTAANKDGFYMVAGSERRQMGTINGLFYLIIPGEGLLCSPKIPDTLLFGADMPQFGAEGLLLTPEEPMKKWMVTYNGKMRYQHDETKLIDVKFHGEWTSKWKHFDYDTDLHAPAIARSIAREEWSKKYFDTLRTAHQSHYEQFGMMTASMTINGKKYEIMLDSFRDHSYGIKRDWTLMHRYIFHHIFCEDGLNASIGVICQPCTATFFEVGVVCLPNDKNNIVAVEWCDLKLYQHGENGIDPDDYAFQFQAGGKVYTVEVKVAEKSQHFVDPQWNARMVERFIHCRVNGVMGWGVSEFHYNNKNGRPEKYKKNDPNWFKNLDI